MVINENLPKHFQHYRCHIINCDENETNYNPDWLKNYVPYENQLPNQCLVYDFPLNSTKCPDVDEINKNTTKKCNSFIYERQEPSIIQDVINNYDKLVSFLTICLKFKLNCKENLWKLTIVGTINVIGEMFCLSYTGFVSDKYKNCDKF